MKKCIFVLMTALLTLPEYCTAQLFLGGEDKGFSFGYNNGVNFPLLDFGRENFFQLPLARYSKGDTTRLSGYADGIKTSFHYDFYASYRFSHHVSVMVSYAEDVNTFDITTLNKQYQAVLPPGQVKATSGDNFDISQFLIGAYFNFPFGFNRKRDSTRHHSFHINPIRGHLSWECKLLAGLTIANYPSVFYTGISQTVLYSVNPGDTFGFFGGTGLQYEVFDGLGIHFEVNYAGAFITYPGYSISTYSTNSFAYSSASYSTPLQMAVGMLQVTAGFSLEF